MKFILGVFLVYAISYYVLTTPTYDQRTVNGYTGKPSFKWEKGADRGNSFLLKVYQPMHWLDKKIRPGWWEWDRTSNQKEPSWRDAEIIR